MDFGAFELARLPRILFGAKKIQAVPKLVASFGTRVLVVTGAHSFTRTHHWSVLQRQLNELSLSVVHGIVAGEPSPQLIDEAVKRYRHEQIDVVVGIGGGSVIDAGKAIAGLLPFGNSVLDHLEGVGKGIPYVGPSLSFIAVPTTAGTGSEATKNAVLSVQGEHGYKKSFRHDALIPSYAVVDPELLASCPPGLIAANGMDALTQLLESYVATKANPLTDALAWSGLEAVASGLLPAWRGGTGSEAQQARSQMAYGALLSGITLAHAGLGAVHGLAAPLGAFFPIAHGIACGATVAAATAVNLAALRTRAPNHVALSKYARVGKMFAGVVTANDHEAQDALVQTLIDWGKVMQLPKLSAYGVTPLHFDKLVMNSRGNSMQTNPIVLSDNEVRTILEQCV